MFLSTAWIKTAVDNDKVFKIKLLSFDKNLTLLFRRVFLLVALQKTPSLLGAECRGVGTTPLHANERGQNTFLSK